MCGVLPTRRNINHPTHGQRRHVPWLCRDTAMVFAGQKNGFALLAYDNNLKNTIITKNKKIR